MRLPYRVVQLGTGNVGQRTLAAIIRRPTLELVGCVARAEAKWGVDVGTFAGVDPTGVLMMGDVAQAIALAPDVVVYSARYLDIDVVAAFLEAGINVVTSSEFITGHSIGVAARSKLERAALAGGASMFGTGIDPGAVHLLAINAATICERVDSITVTESVNVTSHDCAEVHIAEGFGCPIEDDLPERTRAATLVYEDAVHLVANAIGVTLDDMTFESEYILSPDRVDVGFMVVEPGTIGAMRYVYTGWADGAPVVTNVEVKTMDNGLCPWPLLQGYQIDVVGVPSTRLMYNLLPPADWSESSYSGLGMIASGMPVVNAIPAVCEAPPGIVTYAHLPPSPGQSRRLAITPRSAS